MEITIEIYVYTYVTAFCQTDQTIQGYFEKFILYHIVFFFYIKLKTLNGLTTLATELKCYLHRYHKTQRDLHN